MKVPRLGWNPSPTYPKISSPDEHSGHVILPAIRHGRCHASDQRDMQGRASYPTWKDSSSDLDSRSHPCQLLSPLPVEKRGPANVTGSRLLRQGKTSKTGDAPRLGFPCPRRVSGNRRKLPAADRSGAAALEPAIGIADARRNREVALAGMNAEDSAPTARTRAGAPQPRRFVR